jgi:signal transduction histidine kinase
MAKSIQGTGAAEFNIDTCKQIAVAVVHASAVGLGEVLKKYRSEAERADLIRTYIDKIRFFPDQSGYFFVYNMNGMNIALPNPNAWQGKNLFDHQDSKGRYVIREVAEAAKKGGGFVEYYWPRPGVEGEQKKLSYAETIPGTGYFIGAGFYI